jgi:hypothetical protein
VIVILLIAPATWLAEPVIAKLTAAAGDTVTLNGVEVVIPVAVALMDLGCASLELTSTIGTLEATPLLNDTLVALPKLVPLTVGLFEPITLDPLKVNDSVPL